MAGTRSGRTATIAAAPGAQIRDPNAANTAAANVPPQVGNNPGGGNGNPGGDGGGDGGGGGGNQGGGNPPPGLPPRPPHFSLTPGGANLGILDYSQKTHFYHYKGATAKLEEELYDCTPDGFYQFVKSLKKRAESYGWTKVGGVFMMLPNNNPDAQPINLLEDYGQVTLERVQEHERTYINLENRMAQDDRMIYECIMASLSIEGKAKLNIHEQQYHIGANNMPELPSGLCLFKVLVREAHLDSKATSGMIRTELSNLDDYMSKIGNDIVKFNGHVTILLDTLTARGETTQDLVTNLFKGYAACSDKTFVKYIADRQDEYEDGRLDLDSNALMQMASNKYKIMKTKNIWEAPSPEEEKLLALEARFQDLKKRFANKRKGNDSDGNSKDPKKPKSNKKGGKKEKKEKPSWMFVKPDDSKLKEPREWNGTNWYWCSKETGGKCDGQYRAHTPSACRGTARSNKKGNNKKSDHSKRVTINEAVEEIEGGYEST